MAVKKIVEIEVNSNAEKAIGSLRSELRKAQQDVTALSDKFGATSKEAVQAAKRASELKDRIGDAKALTDAFNPDAKFKALSSSLSGVASGFAAYQGALGLAGKESKQLEEQLLKVQSAMAVAGGLQGLGEARDSFKQLKAVAIDAFNGIKAAIGSSGIGLLVVALGAVYTYWDDIKEAVSGVSEEQTALNEKSKTNLDQELKKLDAISDQDNILKLQGKSEKQILEYKIKQTNEAIEASRINLENIKVTNKEQEKAAKQNYEYLKSFLDFISIPQKFLYENGAKAINGLIELINKIPGVDIKARVDEKFGDKATEYLTKLAFDPEKVKKDGEQAVEEQQKVLTKLLNDRAGYQLQVKGIDKKDSDDKNKAAEEYAKSLAEGLKEFNLAVNDAFVKQIDLNIENKQREVDAMAALSEQNTKMEEENAKAQVKIAKYSAKEKIDALSAISDAIGNAADLAGRQTGVGKALAIAQATISMFTSAQKAYEATVGIPIVGPTLAPINAGLAIAAGLKNIKEITKIKVPGGGGGGAPSVGGQSQSAPNFNVVGNSGVNQIAQTLSGKSDQAPIKAYVVANDVTTAQNLSGNIISNASLG